MGVMKKQKGKKKRQRRIILLVVIVVVLAVVACILWFAVPEAERKGRNPEGAINNAEPGKTVDPVKQENNGTTAEPDNGSELAYFDEGRAERYEAYAAMMPGLALEDVIWMVNVDLDKEPYEAPSEVPDPMSLTLLVNKHFMLPEGFKPSDLVTIGATMMRAEAANSMNELIDAAAAEGHHLWVQSGFRSYEIQVGLYEQYSAQDGVEAADTYSARPGHSEHQTGLTADFNTITEAFGETPEGIWAAENCWKYGFIIRYTAENTDVTLYKPEPWHVRYIGREAAAGMRDLGFLSFEEYWVKYVNQ